jgi:hypothetical protein
VQPVLSVESSASPGEFRRQLRERLQDVDAVLLLVTPAALESGWVMVAVGMAEGLEKPVVPVTAGLEPEELPPGPLSSYQAVTYDRLDEGIAELMRRLSQAGEPAQG